MSTLSLKKYSGKIPSFSTDKAPTVSRLMKSPMDVFGGKT
jgi:hypothetical protein